MECTQRLECTQDFNETQRERVSPEQVGFLGINGQVYPIMRGPNKIGRDPKTCSIVLNLNSVSRQHAVINILNKKDFMLMDLDSANKTKLLNKNLLPYIPHPLKDGDTVQFGEVFGIFRVLEDDDYLPMTQALDIPDTPIANKHPSKLIKATTVPESPDVSDRDDSFIIPSQPTDKKIKSTGNHNFIKPATRTISIQPVGTNKIDNIFWNSSKKSTSMTLNDTSSSLNDSLSNAVPNKDDIHEMETQPPVPVNNESTDSIYTADTQVPGTINSNSIHSLDTQLPVPTTEHLPQVQKVNDQVDMQLDIFTANKENENSIYNAETQMFPQDKSRSFALENASITEKDTSKISKSSNKSNVSDDDELLFDEVDDPVLEENFESQAILPDDLPPIFNDYNIEKELEAKPKKRDNRIKSDSSTDCEDNDILPTQQIQLKKEDADDDVTDCEDDFIELKIDKSTSKPIIPLEEMDTQVIVNPPVPDERFHDLPTQVLTVEETSIINPVKGINTNDEVDIEDMCTQVIPNNPEVIEVNSPDVVSHFKVPLQSPRKAKRKETPQRVKPAEIINNDEEYYYANTQDLRSDLDSQQEYSPEIVGKIHVKPVLNKSPVVTERPFNNTSLSVKVPNFANDLSPRVSYSDKTSGSSDGEEKVNKFVSNLSTQQIRDVIGVVPAKKMPSDGSDVDVTPKKVRPFKLMTMDLPNSQEIKTSVTLPSSSLITDSSSDSEPECNSEEQCTPILFKKNKKTKVNAKIDLSKRFEIDALPTRIITRRRKPTKKVQQADEAKKSLTKSILKPKFLTEQDDIIDSDIITENISRLKTKHEKSKLGKTAHDVKKEVKPEARNVKKVDLTIESGKDTDNKDSAKKKGASDTRYKTKDPNEQSNEIKLKEVEKEIKKDTRRGRPKKDANKEKTIETSTYISKSESSIDLTKTNRSTRSKHKKSEKVSISPEKEVKPERSRRHKKKEEVELIEENSEVRRSKRQRVAKEKKEVIKVKIKSILKKTSHEQSTVYNISSASSCDTPRSLKRLAVDKEGPSAKRSKAANSSITPRAATKQGRTQYVLFTAFPCDEVGKKLERLGAVVVTDVLACTVVLTLQIKRTFKLLCAVGLGRPIVGPSWVQACADHNVIVDPWPYIIKDEAVEKRFHFNLERTLSGKRNFLKGYNVSSTPSVLPSSSEMKLIVECSGGTWKEEGPMWVCVSSAADKHLWASLRRRGATIVSTEFILGGVLKQTLDINANKY